MVINYSCYYILIHNCRGIWWRSGQRGTTSEYNQSTCIRRIDVNTVMEGSLGSITGQCKKKKNIKKTAIMPGEWENVVFCGQLIFPKVQHKEVS